MANHNHDHDLPHASHTESHSPHSSPSASHSPTHSQAASTTVTTPDQSSGSDDDIWATSSAEEGGGGGGDNNGNDQPRLTTTDEENGDVDALLSSTMSTRQPPNQNQPPMVPRERILSDIPTLRRQHMTDGYREGLSIGKAQVMQDGFDVGYPVGVEVGMRVGVVLGVLEGILAAVRRQDVVGTSGRGWGGRKKGLGLGLDQSKGSSSSSPNVKTNPVGLDDNKSNVQSDTSSIEFVTRLYDRAKKQLSITELIKGLDDEKLARLHETTTTTTTTTTTAGGLPAEIEHVVASWELLVLGALRRDDVQLQQHQHQQDQQKMEKGQASTTDLSE